MDATTPSRYRASIFTASASAADSPSHIARSTLLNGSRSTSVVRPAAFQVPSLASHQSVSHATQSPVATSPASSATIASTHRFPVDDITAIIKESTDTILSSASLSSTATSTYNHSKIPALNAAVSERCLAAIQALHLPFKYVVTCVVLQKSDAGVCAVTSCWWEEGVDGVAVGRWEGRGFQAIVSVYGFSV